MSADDHNPTLRDGDHARLARLDDLLERLCDQLATEDELAEINTILGRDKSDREYYLRYIALHSSLQRGVGVFDGTAPTSCFARGPDLPASGDAASVSAATSTVSNDSSWTRSKTSIFWGLAIAATLLVMSLSGVRWWGGPAGEAGDAWPEHLADADTTNSAGANGGSRSHPSLP